MNMKLYLKTTQKILNHEELLKKIQRLSNY